MKESFVLATSHNLFLLFFARVCLQMIPSLTSIESFFWAAQLLSFRGAADFLHVSQPTISYRIRELEEKLGVQLFARKGRGIQLTSAGSALYTYAERMMSIAGDVDAHVSVRRHTAQPIRLGVIDSFALACVPELMKRIDAKFAELRVSVTIENSHTLTNQLSTGMIDLAILSTPPNLPGIELSMLGKQTVSWVASPKLGLGGRTLPSRELRKQRIFSTPSPSNLHYLILGQVGIDPGDSLRVNECNSLTLILGLLKEGLGVAVMPSLMAKPDILLGLLEALSVDAPALPEQDVFLAHNKGIVNRSIKSVSTLIRDIVVECSYCT